MSDLAGDGPLGGAKAGDALKAVKDSARSTALQQFSRIEDHEKAVSAAMKVALRGKGQSTQCDQGRERFSEIDCTATGLKDWNH